MALITLLSSHRHHCAQLALFSSQSSKQGSCQCWICTSGVPGWLFTSLDSRFQLFRKYTGGESGGGPGYRAGTAPTHHQHSLILLIVFTTKTPLSGKLKDKWKYWGSRIKAGSCTLYITGHDTAPSLIKLTGVVIISTEMEKHGALIN